MAQFASDRDKESEEKQSEEIHDQLVLHQREEAATESLDEEATIEVVQKSAEKLLFATPQSLQTVEMTFETQEETVSLNEVLTVADDDSESQLYVEESVAVSEVQMETTRVHRDVEVTELVTVHDVFEEEAEVALQQEMTLQDGQTVEIVEKTGEECTEVTITLPQLVTLETDQLRSDWEQERCTVALTDAEDLLTLQISRESFSEDDSISVNIVTQQLHVLHLAEEMELIIPMAAGTETSEDRTSVDKSEKLDESVDSGAEADKSAFVIQAEKETGLKPEQQMREDPDTTAQPEIQFDISTIEPDSKASETAEPPDERTSEQIKAFERRHEEGVRQLVEEPAATEEDLKEIKNKSVFVAETVEEDAIWSEEKVEKTDETFEEPVTVFDKAQEEKAEHLQTETLTGTLATEVQEETTDIVQCTETIYDDETASEFVVMLPTDKTILTHPLTDTKVESYDKCIEVWAEVEECEVKVAEETRHIRLYVDCQGISSSQVEVMLPVSQDETRSLASDVETVICVEEKQEMQKTLDSKILSKAGGEDTSEVDITVDIRQQTDEECQKEVTMEAKRVENTESAMLPAVETATIVMKYVGDEAGNAQTEEITYIPSLQKEMLLSQKVVTERSPDEMKDETGIIATSRKLGHLESVIAETAKDIETTTSAEQQQIVNVPRASEEHEGGTARRDRHEIEPSTEFIAQQLVTQAFEIATADMTQAVDAMLITPRIITEGEAVILLDEQGGEVIETLRPAASEKEFAGRDSNRSASVEEEIEIGMKTERVELTTACGSEEGQLLTGTHDVDTREEDETMKPVIEEAITSAVVFPSRTEHEIDLLVFQHVFDAHELAILTTDALSHSENEVFGELSEGNMALEEQEKSETCLVPGVATTQPYEVRSETESTLLAASNEVATTATDTTIEGVVTMQFSRESVTDELEVSQPVFPALLVDDSVIHAALAVCRDTTHEMFHDDTLQFHKTLETPTHLKTDSALEETTTVMTDEKCTIPEDVQPELSVPYSSVILHSDDICAQTDAAEEHLSISLVDKCVVDSVHITETHSPEQDEHALGLSEELLCDNLTVVFPENVESSLLGDQASSSITENEIVDLPEHSLLLGSSLFTDAEKDALQRDDYMDQLQITRVESTVIQMKLTDDDDTLTVRPEKPEFSDAITLEEKKTEVAHIGDEMFQGSVDKEDVVMHSAAYIDDVCPLKTDVQNPGILLEAHLTCEKNVDVLLDRIAADENRQVDKADESEEDLMQLSTVELSLHDGTFVHVVHQVEVVADTSDLNTVPVVQDVDNEVDTPHTEEAMILLDDSLYTDGQENVQSVLDDDQTCDATLTYKILEPMSIDHRTSSSVAFQIQQFEASGVTETCTEMSDSSYTETTSGRSESNMEKRATSKLTTVDSEESEEATKIYETMSTKPASCKLISDDGQPDSDKSDETTSAVPQSEDEIKSKVDLPWSLLFADLFGDDNAESVTFSADVSKDDAGNQDLETSDVEREKAAESQAVSDDKRAGSSKSSVVTRKVQRVSADGRVVERVKSEEVPMSFGPDSLTPYFFGGDFPSPPDFSPQSDDRLSSANSVKVYTDTVEGEAWTERRVEEVEETRPDGATVTRKVVRVRKRRTIIKHIVIEGPEFEEMVLDETDKEALSGELREAWHVDEQLEPLASECKQTVTHSAARQLSTETDVAITNEDFSYIQLTETEHTQSDKQKTTEHRDDKDTTSSVPSLGTPVSLELSDTRVSSLGEAQHYSESEYLLLDLERDTSSSAGDGVVLDNVESASSCGDFATGILCYSHASVV